MRLHFPFHFIDYTNILPLKVLEASTIEIINRRNSHYDFLHIHLHIYTDTNASGGEIEFKFAIKVVVKVRRLMGWQQLY